MLLCARVPLLWSTASLEVNNAEQHNRRKGGDNYPSVGRAQKLFSPRGGVAVIHPIRAEIVSNVENLDIGESHGAQCVIGRLDRRAVAPRAASAVQNDELRPRQGRDALPQLLQPRFTRSRANVLRAWDVRLRKQNVRAHLDDERLLLARGLEQLHQVLGTNELCGWNGCCLTCGLNGEEEGNCQQNNSVSE